MKRYGANKATEFTKKQISVIYGKAKNGELKVEKWVISEFYDLAEYYGYDSNRSVEQAEFNVLKILEAVFSNDLINAQNLIDEYTEDSFRKMSRKNQSKCNRNLLVG